VLDAGSVQALRESVAKGVMPLLVLIVEDCRAGYERLRERGVESTQEPVECYGTLDAVPRSFQQRVEDATRVRMSGKASRRRFSVAIRERQGDDRRTQILGTQRRHVQR
jgi:hypothetical protein